MVQCLSSVPIKVRNRQGNSISAGDTYRFDMDPEVGDDGSMMTKTVTITLSAAAAYMVLVVGLMLYCRYRRRRRKQQYLQEQAEGIYPLRSLHESVSDFDSVLTGSK